MSQPFDSAGERRSFNPNRLNVGILTAVLIGISVVVAIVTKLGDDRGNVARLLISQYGDPSDPLPEVFHGQPWRVLTPIFLHFGLMHIFFNMVWLKDLGTAIEKLSGRWTLLALVWVIGIISNLAQYHFTHNPIFGGMSGVVYGLLGFVWMKSRFDRSSGYLLHNQTVLWMIGWFLLCAFNVIPHVANWAHGAGLALGMIWGFASAKARPA